MDMRASARPTSLTAPRGRPFLNGNPGRKLGSKNRSTVIAAALLEDQKSALLRKGIELALAGDVHMLKFFLGRLLPRDRLVKFDLPKMEFADDGVEAHGRIADAISNGEISPSEGADLATVVNSWAEAIDLADAVKRLDAIEAKLRQRRAI
jgi:hypothetical protein